MDYRGALASIAAERSDTSLSDSLQRWLATQSTDRVSWTANYYRARQSALLGRTDNAVARLRNAMDEGAWPLWIHLDPALMRLRARRDFAELTAPRD